MGRRVDDRALSSWARFGALGFEFAGTIVTCVLLGYYLDGRVGTAPLFTLLLTFGGMAGALYRLLWVLRRLESREDDGDQSDADR